jgi:hypothetical protein
MGWVVRNGSGYFITRNSLLPQIHKIAFCTFTSSSFHRTSKNPSHGNLIAVVVCPLFCRRRRLSLVHRRHTLFLSLVTLFRSSSSSSHTNTMFSLSLCFCCFVYFFHLLFCFCCCFVRLSLSSVTHSSLFSTCVLYF